MDREKGESSREEVPILLRLSCREGEILALVASGYTNSEIAAHLHLSVRTVENHRYHICKKLGLKGRGALVRWVKQHRLKDVSSKEWIFNYLK